MQRSFLIIMTLLATLFEGNILQSFNERFFKLRLPLAVDQAWGEGEDALVPYPNTCPLPFGSSAQWLLCNRGRASTFHPWAPILALSTTLEGDPPYTWCLCYEVRDNPHSLLASHHIATHVKNPQHDQTTLTFTICTTKVSSASYLEQ